MPLECIAGLAAGLSIYGRATVAMKATCNPVGDYRVLSAGIRGGRHGIMAPFPMAIRQEWHEFPREISRLQASRYASHAASKQCGLYKGFTVVEDQPPIDPERYLLTGHNVRCNLSGRRTP